MTSSGFTSGGALLKARGRDQQLPSWGQKEVEATGSWLEGKQVDARLQDRQTLLEEPKFARRDQMAKGEWLGESRMVRLVQLAGDFWQHMGVETDIGKCLYPEEAIYLIETGEIEITYGEVVVSLQQAQTLMLEDTTHLDRYLVYAHLTRMGGRVVRHQPHLWFSKYEKDIRLDQHQVTKKSVKLQLKNKIDTDNKKEVKKDEGSAVVIDDELAEFYASIGEGAGGSTDQASVEEIVIQPSDSKESKPTRKRERTDSTKDINDYERKRKEIIALFPSFAGKKVMSINKQAKDLYPPNSAPKKSLYKITQTALNYYSKYDGYEEAERFYNVRKLHMDQEQCNNRGRDRWRKNDNRDDRNFPQGKREDTNRWRKDNTDKWGRDAAERGERDANDRWGRDANDRWGKDPNDRWGKDPNDRWGKDPNDRWGRDNSNGSWQSRRSSQYDQHDDRWSDQRDYEGENRWSDQRDYEGDDNTRFDGSQQSTTTHQEAGAAQRHTAVDMTVKPDWKVKKRKKQRPQPDYYPSCLMRLNTVVDSWKEYKKIVNETSAESFLLQGPGKSLWKGRTVPLTKPNMATNTQTVLSSCRVKNEESPVECRSMKISPEQQLIFHYDAYLPTSAFKKSSPSLPDRRITVISDNKEPTPGQILDITGRFQDDVAVVCALVTSGEVRLYTLNSVKISEPCLAD